MRKNLFYVSLFLLCSCSSSDSFTDAPNTPNENEVPNNEPKTTIQERVDIQLTAVEQEMVTNGNKFGFTFFNAVDKNEDMPNFFVSPLSASLALSMATNGADRETLTEMKSVLGFNSYSLEEMNNCYEKLIHGLLSVDSSCELGIANSLWVDKGFSLVPSFVKTNQTKYDATLQELDFSLPETVETINKWCADKTNNRIDKIIEGIQANSKLFLINALYFKGSWKYIFDKEYTSEALFKNQDNTTSRVDMMRQKVGINYTDDEENLQIAELPYGNEAFSMVILLPDAKSSIQETIQKLTSENWEKWMNRLRPHEVNVILPKFKIEYDKLLNATLQDMGMQLPFSVEANFSKMSTQIQLNIGIVKQKTFVEVGEEGTEAAAVTNISVDTSVGDDTPPVSKVKTLEVNRPFIYIIKEKSTGAILFMGKMGQMK